MFWKFLKKHKKRHITEAKNIWGDITRDKIGNSSEYPDSWQNPTIDLKISNLGVSDSSAGIEEVSQKFKTNCLDI